MRFSIATLVTLTGFAASVLAYPTESVVLDGVSFDVITDPDLIFTNNAIDVTPNVLRARAWPVSCGPYGDLAGYSSASSGPILDGINHLLPSRTCTLAANSITRVSCSWSSGIFVQNRETYTVNVDCNYLAQDAIAIYNACMFDGKVIGRRGTTYHSGNTSIRAANC